MINLNELTIDELWNLYSLSIKELKNRGTIRSKNITGERGESLAINFYNNTKKLPKLIASLVGTKNVDATSRDGERYSIKTIMYPNKTTGVFYGLGTPTKPIKEKNFEKLIIVVLSDDYEALKILEVDWKNFFKFKKWHSRMGAFNISLSNELLKNSYTIYAK